MEFVLVTALADQASVTVDTGNHLDGMVAFRRDYVTPGGDIGVDTEIAWEHLPYNEVIFSNQKREMPPHFRSFLRDMYEDDLERLHSRFGERVRPWLESSGHSSS